jgi:hypothetical protein
MIANDKELEVTKERIEYFQQILKNIRAKATPDQFHLMASGYRVEIEKMQAEVMDYLLRPIEGATQKQLA